jgi:hypothetical protein
MKRDHRMMLSLTITAGLVLAACGGSDDEPAVDTASDAPAPEPAADAGDDAPGRSEAQQSLDDAGVDLDLEELEETMSGFSTGEGGGVVTIDGVPYTFEATAACIWQGTDFVAEGLGQDPDGNPAWVSINASVDDFDGDGTEGPSIDIFVEPGRTELFGDGPDDAPDFTATYYEAEWFLPEDEVVYELANGVITGSGAVQDYSGIAIPFGERGEMTFEASCT